MPTAYLSASLLRELTDVSVTAGAGNTGYPLIWNNTSGKFELSVLGVDGGGTGITSFGTGVATALGQNVTGSGGIVLATSPTLVTPTLGAASATSLNLSTDLAVTDGGTGTSTGSITGTGALTFTAGGTNENVTLTPSGTGAGVIAGISIRTGAGLNSQAIGSTANSTGINWLAQGAGAGASNTTGGAFFAQGIGAGASNTTGFGWFAQGLLAAQSNIVGDYWFSQGTNAARLNVSGSYWIAQGGVAAFNNTLGDGWIAQGMNSAVSNTVGSNWIAQGMNAGRFSLTGSNWIAQGFEAGYFNLTGSNWIAQGFEAGYFEERGSTWHVGVGRSKSLVVGRFDTDCLYLGHAGPITSAATCPNPTAAAHLAASTTARASLRIDSGVAPTTPNDGDIWFDGAGLRVRIAGVTRTIQVV